MRVAAESPPRARIAATDASDFPAGVASRGAGRNLKIAAEGLTRNPVAARGPASECSWSLRTDQRAPYGWFPGQLDHLIGCD